MNELITESYGYLHSMWRYRWSALLVTWVVALGGWLFVYSLPNQYNAKAAVYIDTTSVLKPMLAGLALETDSYDELNIMTRVMLSRKNLLSVIRETDMDLEVDTLAARERLAEKLAGTIAINGSEGNIYEISYESTSADRVYQVVSILLNSMIENTLNSSRTDTVAAQDFIDKQIAKYEERLTIAEQELARFKKENVGFMPDEKGGYYTRLKNAQEGIEHTRSAIRVAQRRVTELNKQLRGEEPLLGGSSAGSASAVRLRQYQNQLNVLLGQYTEQHPDVDELKLMIADLKAGMGAGEDEELATGAKDSIEFNPVYQDLKAEISKARVDVGTLKLQLVDQKRYIEELKRLVDVIPEVEAKLVKLNRDYDVTKGRYISLVERRESVRLGQEAGESSSDVTFRVIDPPIVPTRPSGPKRILLLVGVLFASIGAGLGWSLLRYMMDPTYNILYQVGSRTGLPVLGAVSLYLSPEHRKKRRLQLASFLSVFVLLLGLFGGVLWYRDIGVTLVDTIISGSNKL
jgi:polysaccharide chain length determinant protein (PEP-CTERM system associated)